MKIEINKAGEGQRKAKPGVGASLGFGRLYTDHMFKMAWDAKQGWQRPEIVPYQPLQMDPATLVLHYAQTIFEGLKAYRRPDGGVNLFRPQKNMERMNLSAARMVMPQLDEALFFEALRQLVKLDQDWVPSQPGASLYLRPTLIATEPLIGLRPSSSFLFFIIASPVGAYYPEGFNPVSIQVCERYSRAGPGGLGACKAGANYAASLLAQREANNDGFTQVLWLDACERRYLEEVGSMNIFVKMGGKVITPPLSGTILAGVTRDSVIQLIRSWGVEVEERRIAMDELVAAQKSGALEEMFGSGTAAVISPVGLLNYQGADYPVADGKTGPMAQRLYDEITAIQYGQKPDPFGWVVGLDLKS